VVILQRFTREGAHGHRDLLQALRALLRRDDDLLDLRRRRPLLRQRRAGRKQQPTHEPQDRFRVVHVDLPALKIAIAIEE
jgi:hypothetical protein